MSDTRTGASWTCIGFFGRPRHDLCNVVGCTCACHPAVIAPSPADSKHSPDCVRCGAPAHMWSGAWLVTASKLWIGWCSNVCKNAWLNGDKGPADTTSPSTEGHC